MNTQYWIYILNCANGTFYTGYTTDLERRFAEHVSGSTKCKYTRSFKALGIAHSWRIVGDKSAAMKIEQFIKRLSRKGKEELITNPKLLQEWFIDYQIT